MISLSQSIPESLVVGVATDELAGEVAAPVPACPLETAKSKPSKNFFKSGSTELGSCTKAL